MVRVCKNGHRITRTQDIRNKILNETSVTSKIASTIDTKPSTTGTSSSYVHGSQQDSDRCGPSRDENDQANNTSQLSVSMPQASVNYKKRLRNQSDEMSDITSQLSVIKPQASVNYKKNMKIHSTVTDDTIPYIHFPPAKPPAKPHVLVCAEMCENIYDKDRKEYKGDRRFDREVEGNCDFHVGHNIVFDLYWDKVDLLAILVIKGTDNLLEWIINASFNIRKFDEGNKNYSGLFVHVGWHIAAEDVHRRVMNHFPKNMKKLIITGHSLGGACG